MWFWCMPCYEIARLNCYTIGFKNTLEAIKKSYMLYVAPKPVINNQNNSAKLVVSNDFPYMEERDSLASGCILWNKGFTKYRNREM